MAKSPVAPAETAAAAADTAAPVETSVADTGQRVIIANDVLRLTVSTRGAEIRQAELLTYPVSLERKDIPVKLLNEELSRYFISQTGLVAVDAPAPDHTASYTVAGDRFELAAGENVLEVPFTWTDASGVSVRKLIRLERGSFAVGVRHEINNQSAAAWKGSQYRQMQRVPPPRPSAFAFNNPELYAYVGASIYSPDEKYQKLKFDDFLEEPYRRTFAGGWSAMQQHYFVGAWVPDAAEQTTYETAILQPNGGLPTRYLMRQKSPLVDVAPGASASISARLYLGPKLQDKLPEVAPGLQYTVDYGMVSFIAQPLFWILSWIHKLVGNWGVAIILLTLLVKLAFYRLSESQYRSMAKMRKLQPRLEQLKERYGDDRQKMAQAQMDLFKQEKVNPDRRLPALAAAVAGVLRALLGDLRGSGTAPGAVLPVDPRPLAEGPDVHPAGAERRRHVVHAEDVADAGHGPGAEESAAVDAAHLRHHVRLLPRRPGAVLAVQRPARPDPAGGDHEED
jgi:YidC/Oxa1 family membrane protein insertase